MLTCIRQFAFIASEHFVMASFKLAYLHYENTFLYSLVCLYLGYG